jgi:hypothetical protein
MTKNKFLSKLAEGGDIFVTVYEKGIEKEYLVTQDYKDSPYIMSKLKGVVIDTSKIPVWNFNKNFIDYINPKKVKSVSDLSAILNNKENSPEEEITQ